MVLGKFIQTPTERKRYTADYTDWLDTGELVDDAVFVALPVTVPPLVIDGVEVFPDGSAVQFYVSGGVDRTDYVVDVTMTTTIGQIKEDTIKYVVRDPTP